MQPFPPVVTRMRSIFTGIGLCLLAGCGMFNPEPAQEAHSHLQRARVFMAAGDYRRAIDACQQEVAERPSAAGYVYLTYVYQSLQGYLDSLVRADRWVAVEQLTRSLSSSRPEDLMDSPDVLARIAKELIHDAAGKQADIAAAMATRLDEDRVKTLWTQQKRWREQQPDRWWFGVPIEWGW